MDVGAEPRRGGRVFGENWYIEEHDTGRDKSDNDDDNDDEDSDESEY